MTEDQALEIVANVCNRVPLNMEDNNLLRQALATLNAMKERAKADLNPESVVQPANRRKPK